MASRPLLATAAALTALAAPLAPVQAQIAAGTGAQIGSAGGVHGEVELAAASFDASNRAIGHRIGSGEPIYQGDLIATGPGGGLQVLLLDQTVFSIGENARMTIDAMSFDPTSNDGKIDFNVEQGSFRFVSGQIAAAHPENVSIRIPEGSIGIRGTIVGGVVGPGSTLVALLGPGGDNNGGARNGAIAITTPAGTVGISRAGFASIITPGAPPSPPAPLTPAQIQQLNRATRPSGGTAPSSGGQGQSAAGASGQATAAGQDTVHIATDSHPGPPANNDFGTIVSTGDQIKLVQEQMKPVATLASAGGGAITTLTTSVNQITIRDTADGSFYTGYSASDISVNNSYSFTYADGTLTLTDTSHADTLAPYTLGLCGDCNEPPTYTGSGTAGSAYSSYTLTVQDYASQAGLTYVAYGTWTKKLYWNGSDQFDMKFGVFATGVPTPTAQMPGSGSATYSGGAVGFLVSSYSGGAAGAAALTGSSSLTANFSSGTIAGTLSFASSSTLSGATSNGLTNGLIIDLSSSSFKGGNSFTGSASSSTLTGSSGSYSGTFYGTSAAEVAGTAKVNGSFGYTTYTDGGPTPATATATVIATYGAKK